MKLRNTHCVELSLNATELARALGHPGAHVREAEVTLRQNRVDSVRVYLEYTIATQGIPKLTRRLGSPTEDLD